MATAKRQPAERANHDTAAMRVICGWCGHVMRETAEKSETSHGICRACSEAFQRAKHFSRR
jgi:uncharacterized CHY-type Zn-finger protein